MKKRSNPRRMNGTARTAIASVASAPARSPRGHGRPQAGPREHEREHDERHEHDELRAKRSAEDRADVLHVRQLALVERGRAVGQRRALEQRDPRRARLDRAQPDEGQRLALVVGEAVAIGRKPVPPELVAHERVGREHTERVHDEHRRDDEGDQDRRGRPPRPASPRGARRSTVRTGVRSRATSSTRAARTRPRAGRRRPRSGLPLSSCDASAPPSPGGEPGGGDRSA